RAVVEDFEIASIQGIRSRIYYPLGFGLGVGLASVAGSLMAPLFSVSPFVGSAPLLKAFIVVILGGLGSIPGAAVAGIALGLVESYGSLFFSSSTADMLIFVLVIIMLVVRPRGILGKGEVCYECNKHNTIFFTQEQQATCTGAASECDIGHYPLVLQRLCSAFGYLELPEHSGRQWSGADCPLRSAVSGTCCLYGHRRLCLGAGWQSAGTVLYSCPAAGRHCDSHHHFCARLV